MKEKKTGASCDPCDPTKPCDVGPDEMEERALSVFSCERNEDLTALIFCLITTFVVLLFTKWLA